MNRRILLLPHTGRDDAIEATATASRLLREAGLQTVMTRRDLDEMHRQGAQDLDVDGVLNEDFALTDIELGMVLGGDGSILRSAELVRQSQVPLLGVNLGHVGFLAEAERSDLFETIRCIVEHRYTIEERITIDVAVYRNGELIGANWALNEASVEKSNRERMLELVVDVDGRPISTFGGDGVVMATPTGSTAYAFSAGGPVVWPEVDALLLVPLSAHALFARPLVVSPASTLAVEIMDRTQVGGVLWCDGRRAMDVSPGTRIEVTRSAVTARLARTHSAPFSERLVAKFNLPTVGWRGPSAAKPEGDGGDDAAHEGTTDAERQAQEPTL